MHSQLSILNSTHGGEPLANTETIELEFDTEAAREQTADAAGLERAAARLSRAIREAFPVPRAWLADGARAQTAAGPEAPAFLGCDVPRQIPLPQIPAFLPANRHFLAAAEGTQPDTGLAALQQTLSDQTAAISAGLEAGLGVQREILEAVLGIRIGDDLIGQAVERYEEKMTIVRGW